MERSMLNYQDSPFSLNHRDVQQLSESEGFALLRSYLAEHYPQRRCKDHTFANDSILQSWVLSRDILHALLAPVVELFNKAVSIAEQTTRASKAEDHEYAFQGKARFAFVWLQSFLERERTWCLTYGCAGCVVEHALDSEFSIRLLYAASYLSDITCPSSAALPTLPSFLFFCKYLAAALHEDDLWRDDQSEQMQAKAMQLKEGLEELMYQTSALEDALSTQDPIEDEESYSLCWTQPILIDECAKPETRVKRGKFARRQRAMEREEEWWMEQIEATLHQRIDAQARCVPIAT